MKKPAVFYKVDKLGNIEGVWTGYAEEGEIPNKDRPIRAKDREIPLLKHPRKMKFHRGRVVPKPIVKFIVDKGNFIADGKDIAIVRLEGVPDTYSTVRVNVAGVVEDVDPEQRIEISTDTSQTIFIQLLEPMLQSEPLKINAELAEDGS